MSDTKDSTVIAELKHEAAIREWNLCVGIDGNIGPLYYAAVFEGLPMRLLYSSEADLVAERTRVAEYLRKWADALEEKK